MADAPKTGGFGSRGGDRGRGRGRRGPRRGANKNEEKDWQPVTKLGRLVKAGKIKSMEEIYLHSLPIKEYQIVDQFLPTLKDEVMKVWFLSFHWENSFATGGVELSLLYPKLTTWLQNTDQACPEADPCRSADKIQGYCYYW